MANGGSRDEVGGSKCLSTLLLMAAMLVGAYALLNNNKSRPLLKFCFNSRDQFVQAQCVLCDFYQFSATVLGCNGRTTALMSNITSTEAVCIISNCLQQVRQAQPQFTGRRRRDATEGTTVQPEEAEAEVVEAEPSTMAPQSIKELLDRYHLLDQGEMSELEEQVVDRVEVNVGSVEEEDYDL